MQVPTSTLGSPKPYRSISSTNRNFVRVVAGIVVPLLFFLFLNICSFAQQRPATDAKISRSGVLELFYADNPGKAEFYAYLNTAKARIPLHFKQAPDNVRHGDSVSITGLQAADGSINVSGLQVTSLAAATGVYGAQSTLVILVNFSDNTATPYTTADTNTAYFTTVSNWYNEVSFGQTWITGQSIGVFTLAAGSATCDYNTWYSQALSAAAAAGVNTANYPHHVLVFPQVSACGWAGLSTVGGSPSYSFINGALGLRVPAHEMGHALGLYHAHSLSCGTVSLLSDQTQCSAIEYGDSQDVMGTSTGHFGAYQKERLGWLNQNGMPPITTVNGGGSFIIGAYEAQDNNVKALKIPRTSSDFFYVEYRTQTGQDATYPAGVLIRLNSTANADYLLDMSPTSPTSFSNPLLPVGATFTDPVTGITIQNVAQDATAVTIAVNGSTTTPPTSTPPPPAATLSVGLTTNSTTYSNKSTLVANVKVVDGNGAALSGASITVTITRPDNSTIVMTGASSTSGTATFSYRFRPKDPKGNYRVQAVATYQGLSATSSSMYLALQ